MRPPLFVVLVLMMALVVSACQKDRLNPNVMNNENGEGDAPVYHDVDKGLTKQDYRSILQPQTPAPLPVIAQALPEVVSPLWPSKNVTLELDPTGSLDTVFLDLTRQAGLGVQFYNLQAKSGYVYRVYDRPLEEVITALCAMADLRCTLGNHVLVVEPDTPYYVTYDLHFLANKRSDEGAISISTDIFSSPFGKKSQSLSRENGSSSKLHSQSDIDFWGEIDTVLQTLLSDPKKWRPLPKKPASTPGSKPSTSESVETSKTQAAMIQPYAVHKQAGLLTVFGTSRQHKLIKDYLMQLKKKVTSQVLIEAKVLEVSLNDEYKSGINWRTVLKGDLQFAAPLVGSMPLANAPPFTSFDTATKNMVTMGASGKRFGALMQMVQSFGTVRTLSNPRLTVVNNQPAVLKVAENKVYFQVKYDRKFITDNNGNVSFSDTFATESIIHTIPIGFVMSVHPSIDTANNEVLLTLRPSITRTSSSVEDPAVAIVRSSVVSMIPVVEVREMDSVIRLGSGQIAVMGGLMQEHVRNSETGLPGLADIPIIGNLFKGKSDDREVTELVIFLQATILSDTAPIQTVTPADERLYTTFGQDPRPFNLPQQSPTL